MTPRAFTFSSRDGLRIEAEIDEPDDAVASLVLCHPHPKMGGTMNGPLLLALRDELVSRRWQVLRFNFRGIGESEGESSTGEAEMNEALAAVDVARESGLPVAIAGWSFGAAVAVRVAAQVEDLIGCAAIAPAVDPKPEITAGIPDDAVVSIPLLVVVGANDDQVSPARCGEWSETQPRATFHEIRGANHFFWAKYEQISTIVADWLESLL